MAGVACFVSLNTMSQQHNLAKSVAWGYISHLDAGEMQCVVAETFGVPQSVISRLLNRYLETGNVSLRTGQGRTCATT